MITSATGPILKNGVTLQEGSNKKSGPPRVDDPKHLCAAPLVLQPHLSLIYSFSSAVLSRSSGKCLPLNLQPPPQQLDRHQSRLI
jgi:hypothetical protein